MRKSVLDVRFIRDNAYVWEARPESPLQALPTNKYMPVTCAHIEVDKE